MSTEALAPVARSIGVGEALLLGKGEVASGGREKASILADALEAIIGAVYLAAASMPPASSSWTCSAASWPRWRARATSATRRTSCRSSLPSSGSRRRPTRCTTAGRTTQKLFTAQVRLGGDVLGVGTGPSKKHAERAAARRALGSLAAADAPGPPAPG